MSNSLYPTAFDGSSMDHMEAYESTWGTESHFDNIMFPNQATNNMNFDFHTSNHGHDDCLPCDSPDCDEEPCPESNEAYPCYDPKCYELQDPAVCNDSHGACLGNPTPDVFDGAYHLLGMVGGNVPNGHMYCSDVHPTVPGLQQQHQYMSGTDLSNISKGFEMQDFGANFCNPDYCTFDTSNIQLGDIFYGCDHFPEVGGNLNDLHQFHHHKAQVGGSCAARVQPSPITQSVSDTPSESGPHTPRHQSTPATSTFSPLSAFHSRQPSVVKVAHPTESTENICQWLVTPHQICGQSFATASALQNHVCSAHVAKLTKSNPGFFCKWSGCSRLCETTKPTPFAQKSKLERHLQKHTGHKSETCNVCGQKYATAQTLAQHMKTHDATKACVCDWPGCDYATSQASQLTMHKRTMHLNSKPLECEICGVRFSESSNLSKHKKTHKTPGEFFCGFAGCGKVFKRDDQVQRHWKKHVKDEGVEIQEKRETLIKKGLDESIVMGMPISELINRKPISRKAVIFEKQGESDAVTERSSSRRSESLDEAPRKRAKIEPGLDVMNGEATGIFGAGSGLETMAMLAAAQDAQYAAFKSQLPAMTTFAI